MKSCWWGETHIHRVNTRPFTLVLPFYRSPSFSSISGVHFLLQSRVSTFIPGRMTGENNASSCFACAGAGKIQPSGSMDSVVNARFMGKQCTLYTREVSLFCSPFNEYTFNSINYSFYNFDLLLFILCWQVAFAQNNKYTTCFVYIL